jgi:hypothetical protein
LLLGRKPAGSKLVDEISLGMRLSVLLAVKTDGEEVVRGEYNRNGEVS